MTKNWKKTGYLLPEVLEPDENICICVPIPKDWGHINAFTGQISELAKWLTWEKDGTDSALLAARRWIDIVQCVLDEVNCAMSTGCGCGGERKPTNTRINPVTGLYEVSYDGGITWELDPGSDPRSSGTVFPPMGGNPGDSLRCAAANSALGFLQEVQQAELDGLENNATIADFILLLTGFLGAIGIFFAFVPAAIAAMLAFVVNFFGHRIAADFAAAFDEELWDELFCILYCHIEDDGSYTEAGWLAVKDELDNDIGNYGLGWMYNHINLIGTVGLTNAARANYAGTRECEDCGCDDTWCYLFEFPLDNGDWERDLSDGDDNGTWSIADGWESTNHLNIAQNPDTARRGVFIKRDFDNSTVTKITMVYDYAGGNWDFPTLRAAILFTNGVDRGNIIKSAIVDGTTLNFSVEGDWPNTTQISAYLMSSRDQSSPYVYGGNATIRYIQIEGIGENPFGEDNCEPE